VISLLSKPEVDITELKTIIEHEPSLASSVLRLANSAYARRYGEIVSIKDAIMRLGTETVLKMVIATGFNPLIAKQARSYDLPPEMLWKHSVAVAITSEEIARKLGTVEPAHTYTAGLLHDVGKIVLGSCLEIDPEPILGMALRERISIDIAEQQVLGIDHAESGAILLENWNLPPSVVEVVRWHHQPDRGVETQLMIDLVHVANALCYVCDIGLTGVRLKMCPSCESVARLNLTSEVAEKAAETAKERIESLLPIFIG